MTTTRVGIIGAGVVGLATASTLLKEGAAVTVFDRKDVASGSSGRAAGICYTAFTAEPDCTLGLDAFEQFLEYADDGAPFTRCPYVWFASEAQSPHTKEMDEGTVAKVEDALEDGLENMQDRGIDARRLPRSECADRFPAFRTDDIRFAGLTDDAGYTDPAAFTAWLGEHVEGNGGRIRHQTPVELVPEPLGINTDEGQDHSFDAIVVAAGARTKALLARAGYRIPMKPYRVQALVGRPHLTEPIWYDVTAGYYARPHPDGIFVGDGTVPREADPDTYTREASQDFPETVGPKVHHRLPDSSLDVDRAWAGLCTATPDQDPIVGKLDEGLYVATGFHGQGFMRAPAIGRRLAEQILGADGINAFDPRRFEGDESFAIREGMSLVAE